MAEAEVERDRQHEQLLVDEIVAALEDVDTGDPFVDERCPSCGVHYEEEEFVPVRVGEQLVGECCRYCAGAMWDVGETTVADVLREQPLTVGGKSISAVFVDTARELKNATAKTLMLGLPIVISVWIGLMMINTTEAALQQLPTGVGPAFGAPLDVLPLLAIVVIVLILPRLPGRI